ncbi:MAG: serine kinase [Hyphomicrobiales bacterium]|nr:serine kinase [Hyphomicrobiales bacterium]
MGLAIEPTVDTVPAFTLRLREGVPDPIPATATVVYEGQIFWEGDCVYADDGGNMHLLFPGHISLALYPDRQSAEIVVSPGSISRVGATAGMLAIDAAIDASGQFLLHSAGLTLPGSDEQVLVFARSGTGKTTTSLALAEGGFGLCSDDSMVIRQDGRSVSAWGLPRDLKVHRRTAQLLPWVAPHLKGDWNDEDERAVARADLAEQIRVEGIARRPVGGIFLLERGDLVKSKAQTISQTDTLVSLAADNVRTGKTGILASHRRRFAGLAGLASSMPTFKVTVGSEPRSTAEAIVAAMQSVAKRAG